MKKKMVFASTLGLLLLTGCQEATIQYQGERIPVSEAEEIIADQLDLLFWYSWFINGDYAKLFSVTSRRSVTNNVACLRHSLTTQIPQLCSVREDSFLLITSIDGMKRVIPSVQMINEACCQSLFDASY